MLRFRQFLPAFLITLSAAVPVQANLIINATFDTSITSQSDAAGIESVIDSAIQTFETTYSNSISVSIEFYAMSSGLGESQTGFVDIEPYQTYYNALAAGDANPAAIAGLTENGGDSSKNPVNGTSDIYVKSADLRAVGLSGAPLCNVTGTSGDLTCSDTAGGAGAIDGLVGLNTSITYPPNSNDGSTYSLLAVTEHEIDEILGLGSALPNCTDAANGGTCTSTSAADPEPEDLFRYTANGVFASLNVTCSSVTSAYFSYTGAVDLTNFNTACNGGDWGDWGNNATAQVQDAFTDPGLAPLYGVNEIAAMSAIGYTVATPEPSTWTLLVISVVLFAVSKRRS